MMFYEKIRLLNLSIGATENAGQLLLTSPYEFASKPRLTYPLSTFKL